MNKRPCEIYGKKTLYFTDLAMALRFVKLYGDLFVIPKYMDSKAEGFHITELDTNKGTIFELVFHMNHDEFHKIEKVLMIKMKSFMEHFDHLGDYKYCRKFVCE